MMLLAQEAKEEAIYPVRTKNSISYLRLVKLDPLTTQSLEPVIHSPLAHILLFRLYFFHIIGCLGVSIQKPTTDCLLFYFKTRSIS